MRFPRRTQVSRRVLQLVVLSLAVLTPILARYANYVSARQLDTVMTRFEGSVQGRVLGLTDRALRAVVGDVERGEHERRDPAAVASAAGSLKGTHWSFEAFGLSLTDPLAALESLAASRTLRWVLVAGVLVPVLLTVLLGRFYCAWMCPAGFLLELTGKLRGLLRFLELQPGRVRLWRGNKYLLLAMGLTIAFASGLPFLGYLYPPALLGREAHNAVTVMFDRAEGGLLGFSAAGLTIASWFLIAIALVELVFGPRLWCRSLCPGGAVYSALARFRVLSVRRDATECSGCGACIVACEMGLQPMTDEIGVECDNCGACVSHCPDGALAYAIGFGGRSKEEGALR